MRLTTFSNGLLVVLVILLVLAGCGINPAIKAGATSTNSVTISFPDTLDTSSLIVGQGVIVSAPSVNLPGIVTTKTTPPPPPTIPPVIAGDYLPNNVPIPLTFKAIQQGQYSQVDQEFDFQLPAGKVNRLGLSYSGRYTAFRGQYIYLYNYSTSAWQNVNYSNVGMAPVNVNLPSIANPANYVSADGKVRVR